MTIDDRISETELEKLNLEIENLKRQSKLGYRLAIYVPLITTLVAILGLFLTIWQARKAESKERENRYLNDTLTRQQQERERLSEIQTQIRIDKEQLVEFETDNKISPTRVVFLLDDLGELVERLPKRDIAERKVTDVLIISVWRLPFDTQRDIDFDVQALQKWPPYKKYWQDDSASHSLLLSKKYYTSIAHAYEQNPDCIKKMDFDDHRRLFVSASTDKTCERGLYPVLLFGLQVHLEIIKESNNLSLMRDEIRIFSELTKDSPMARRFAADYLPSNDKP